MLQTTKHYVLFLFPNVYFHLLVSTTTFFLKKPIIYNFQCTLLTSLAKFIPVYFAVSDATVNKVLSLFVL